MKQFQFVDPKNVGWLVPQWACPPFLAAKIIESIFADGHAVPPLQWDKPIKDYCIAFTRRGPNWQIEVVGIAPNGGPNPTHQGRLVITDGAFLVNVPLNAMLKGSDGLSGLHSVYVHEVKVGETWLQYVGVTKRPWAERLAQHSASACAGSNLSFHRALRSMQGRQTRTFVLLAGVSFDAAMEIEERFVGAFTLYPKGLNMIPGGFAGIRYLGAMGFPTKTVRERDCALERIVERTSIAGRPNPLCAARWTTDQEFVNSVICGHSGRLTADQVRNIRMLDIAGYAIDRIAGQVADTARRVAMVLDGKTYARVR